jgi:hypothetical protein
MGTGEPGGRAGDIAQQVLPAQYRLFQRNVQKCHCSVVVWITSLESVVRSDPAWAFPIRTDCVTIFLNVVAVRWNWHITPDLCLATSWLHDLIYSIGSVVQNSTWSGVESIPEANWVGSGHCKAKGLSPKRQFSGQCSFAQPSPGDGY